MVQRANVAVFSELIRSAVDEAGVAGEELLKSVLLNVLNASVESRNVAPAERILRFVSLLGLEPEGVLQMMPPEKREAEMYVVRNAVVALADLADPELLEHIEPALSHAEPRVQQAAVAAMLKTQSRLRAVPLARALHALKPAMLEVVLDDLIVLKDAETVPYLEAFIRMPRPDTKPQVLQRAVAAVWSTGAEEAAAALSRVAEDANVAASVRDTALRALGAAPSGVRL